MTKIHWFTPIYGDFYVARFARQNNEVRILGIFSKNELLW